MSIKPTTFLTGAAISGGIILLTACSSLRNEDQKPELASEQGYFVPQDQAQERGGVGNYVARNSAQTQEPGIAETSESTPADQQLLNSLRQKPESFFFQTNDYNLSPKEASRLNEIASAMKSDPNAKLTIRGYADAQGDPGQNKELSVNRSSSVASYLEGKGVSSDRLTTEGMGSKQPPAAPNSSAANNPSDRVVTVEIG